MIANNSTSFIHFFLSFQIWIKWLILVCCVFQLISLIAWMPLNFYWSCLFTFEWIHTFQVPFYWSFNDGDEACIVARIRHSLNSGVFFSFRRWRTFLQEEITVHECWHPTFLVLTKQVTDFLICWYVIYICNIYYCNQNSSFSNKKSFLAKKEENDNQIVEFLGEGVGFSRTLIIFFLWKITIKTNSMAF